MIDLQINGYAGVDFNRDGLNPDDYHAAASAIVADGVDRFLPTVITDSLEAMCGRLAALAQDPPEAVAGIHIEGPFLNPAPGYIGAHPAEHAIPASVDAMQRLLDAAGGLTRIVTLAPECDPDFAVTRLLAEQDITVAAGHCDPDLDQLQGAIEAGLDMFTHLGNGCPMELHRHDNIIQRVLSCADELWISFIADGAHIPFPALGNYLDLVGLEHAIIVSDAISATGLGPGRFTLGDREVEIGEDLVPWGPGKKHLVGSATPLKRMVEYLEGALGFDEAEIRKMTEENPGALLD